MIFNRVTYLHRFYARISRDGPQRKRFNVKKFAEKYNLEGPLAGNFMRVEYDDNVPAYAKLLGFWGYRAILIDQLTKDILFLLIFRWWYEHIACTKTWLPIYNENGENDINKCFHKTIVIGEKSVDSFIFFVDSCYKYKTYPI